MSRETIGVALLLLFALPARAQQGLLANNFNSVSSGPGIPLINTAISYHKLTWNVSGTVSTCTVALDTSPDNTTWTAGGAIAGQTCTSNGVSAVANVTANYVRMNMTAFSGTGSVSVTWTGYVNNPVSGGAGTGSCGANNFVTAVNAGAPTCAQPAFSNLSGSITLAQSPLTTRGDVLTVNSTPALARLAAGGTNTYPKWNSSTDLVASTLAAAGVGACGSNTFVSTLNADAVPTCTAALTANAGSAHNFFTSVTAPGVFSTAQPTLADVAAGVAGSGTYDFSGVTIFKARVGAGLTTSVNGDIGYDTTYGLWHVYQNGADTINLAGAPSTAGATIAPVGASGLHYAATVVDVVQDSPGVAYAGSSCTFTLTQGSNSVTNASCSIPWTQKQVGSLIVYTAVSPNFRAVVTAVSANGTTLTIGAYYPGSTVTNSAQSNFTFYADGCGRIQASLQNHPSVTLDARGLTGTQNCTVNPLGGADLVNGGGQLLLGHNGSPGWQITRSWMVPPQFYVIGQGKSGNAANTQITASNSINGSNWTDQYSANATVATTVSTTAGTATFTDTGVTSWAAQITAATCIAGTPYGYMTLANTLPGLVEDSFITISSAGNWNGSWFARSVAGTAVLVQFQNNCTAATITASSQVDSSAGNVVQGSYSPAVSGTITSSTSSGSCPNGAPCYIITDTAADFTSNDPGSCTITSGGNTYDVAAFVSTTVIDIVSSSNPSLAGAAFTKKCWVQGQVASTTLNSNVLTTTIGMQFTIPAGQSVTYSLGAPVITFSPFGGNHAYQGMALRDLTLNGGNLAATVGIATGGCQEMCYIDNVGDSSWTAYGLDIENQNAHGGPFRRMQMVTTSPPSSAGIFYAGSTGGNPEGYGAEAITVVGQASGQNPYVGVESGGALADWSMIHCERVMVCVRVNKYFNGQSTTLRQINPGIAEWDGVQISTAGSNISTDVTLTGMWVTNAQGHDTIEDLTTAPGCGSGTTDITSSAVGFYALGRALAGTTGRYRMTTDPGTTSCFGHTTASANTGGISASAYSTMKGCLLGGSSGTTSPAACGIAAAGRIAIPASQTTYTVNTVPVTANSTIILEQSRDNSGLPSSPTCNSGVTAPIVTGRSAGTSFTFALTSVASVTCVDYWIIN